ncbi:MAG: AMP-binding protein [Deltaproteobacteria bacterium]|nr:AMP-binding protein [Deltaproteobacteria bacterium]MBI3388986.1 AMP-binding protein [Deltaproteobacteria bacterium]
MRRSHEPTLTGMVVERARRAPDDLAIVYIGEDGVQQRITAQAVHHDAGLAARALADEGVEPGDCTLLAMRYSRSLIAAWFGALYRGALPSVLPYLTERSDPATYAARVRGFVGEAGARTVITAPEVVEHLRPLVAPLGCQVISSEQVHLDAAAEPLSPVQRRADDPAWLQFTSGTTGGRKGVVVSHAAVLDFLDAYCSTLPIHANDVMITWLPLYHDMGLVSGLALPLSMEIPTVMMSPAYWVRNPVVLMRAIHEFRGTLCNMPNFGFDHCTRSIRDRDLAGIDLSSLRRAGCGGEPVRHATFERFRQRFSAYGLRESVFMVGYGMAENVMTVTQTRSDRMRVEWIARDELQATGRAVPATPESAGAIAVVSNGPPLNGTEVRIVDEQGTTLPERRLGEISVRSAHMMSGYYRLPELSAVALRDGWIRSGDLGFLVDGELFICGRKKDLIIVAGHNLHAEEVEMLAESVTGIQPGRAVAFGVKDERLGTERPVVVCELQLDITGDDTRRVDRELRRLVLQQLDVALGDVRFVAKGWIIKTSSGKLARAANRDKYLADVEPT